VKWSWVYRSLSIECHKKDESFTHFQDRVPIVRSLLRKRGEAAGVEHFATWAVSATCRVYHGYIMDYHSISTHETTNADL
jgi:hypothetical protein